jgi:hypothetical protein
VIRRKITFDKARVTYDNQKLALSTHGNIQAIRRAQMTKETSCIYPFIGVFSETGPIWRSNCRKQDHIKFHSLERVNGSDPQSICDQTVSIELSLDLLRLCLVERNDSE